ncbi:hypothetical protein BCR44DRAFT_73322 [Catenaria anguillulae PL171]|uniref:Uncharacterized protein n=1 Tax=Catenaria anguillulae PL171 TaxID=765915 RepID=A0A1Y2HP82_9FUNG|nr:hypothetical protein BCR44DRAFT_73322 [Catenaria anguillulae PL171]
MDYIDAPPSSPPPGPSTPVSVPNSQSASGLRPLTRPDSDRPHHGLQPSTTPTRHHFVSVNPDASTFSPVTPEMPSSSYSDSSTSLPPSSFESAATIAVSAIGDHVVTPTLGLPVELWVSIAQLTSSSSLVASSSRLLFDVAKTPAVHIAWTRASIRAEYDRASRAWDEKQRKQREQQQRMMGGAGGFGGQLFNQMFGVPNVPPPPPPPPPPAPDAGQTAGAGADAQLQLPLQQPEQGQGQPQNQQQQQHQQVNPINIATGTANGIQWSVTAAQIPVPPGSTPEQVAAAANNMFAGMNLPPGMAAVGFPAVVPQQAQAHQQQAQATPPPAPETAPAANPPPTDVTMSDATNGHFDDEHNNNNDPYSSDSDDDEFDDDDDDDPDAEGNLPEGQIFGGMAYIYIIASPTPLTAYLSSLFRPDYLGKARIPNDPSVPLASPTHPITKPFIDYLTSPSHAQMLALMAANSPDASRLSALTPRPTLRSLISTLPALPKASRDARRLRKQQRARPLLGLVPDGLMLPVFFLLARDTHMFGYSVRRLVRALGPTAFGKEAIPFRELWDRLMRLDARKSSCTNAVTLIQSYAKIEIGYACFLTLVAAMEWNVDALKMLIKPDDASSRPLVADPSFTIHKFLSNAHVVNMFISTVGQHAHAQVVAQLDWLEAQGWKLPSASFRTVSVFAQSNYAVFCELFRRYDYTYLPTVDTNEIGVSQRRQVGSVLVKLLLNTDVKDQDVDLVNKCMELRVLSLRAIATLYVVAMVREWRQVTALIEENCCARMADIYRLGVDTCFSPHRIKHLRTLADRASTSPHTLTDHALIADHMQHYASNPMAHAYTGVFPAGNPFGNAFAPPDTVAAIKRLVKAGLERKFTSSTPTAIYHALLVGELVEHVFSPTAASMWRRAEEGRKGAGVEPKERFIKMMGEAKRDERRYLFASVVMRAVLLGMADRLQPRTQVDDNADDEDRDDENNVADQEDDEQAVQATEAAIDNVLTSALGPAAQQPATPANGDQAQPQPAQQQAPQPQVQLGQDGAFHFTFDIPINIPAGGGGGGNAGTQAPGAAAAAQPTNPNANAAANNNNAGAGADPPGGFNQQQQAILGGVALAMQALLNGAGGAGGGANAGNPAALGAALGGMLGGLLAGGAMGGAGGQLADDQDADDDGDQGDDDNQPDQGPVPMPDPMLDRLSSPPALPKQYWDLVLERMIHEFPNDLLPGGKEQLGELHLSLGYFLAVELRAMPTAAELDNQAVYGLLVQLVKYNPKATLRMLLADWPTIPAWVWQVFKVHTPEQKGSLDKWLKAERVADAIKARLDAGDVDGARMIARCVPESAVKQDVLAVTQAMWDKVEGGMQLEQPLTDLAPVPFIPRRPVIKTSPPTPQPQEQVDDEAMMGDMPAGEGEVVLPGCTVM